MPSAGARHSCVLMPALLWASVLASVSLGAGPIASALAAEHRAFAETIPDQTTFNAYSRELGGSRFTKFIIDLKTWKILYVDVNIYKLHVDFVFSALYHRPQTNEGIIEFNRNYEADKPAFVFGYLVEYPAQRLMTFSFWEGDKIRPTLIRKVRDKLLSTFYRQDLLFRPDSPAQEKLLAELAGLPSITNDKVYRASAYQSFNPGRAIGRLRIIPRDAAYQSLTFGRNEIVVLQTAYPDLTPVAGVISAEFSTPLSHVNLRSRAWGIPNAGIRDAGRRFAALHGKWALFEVEPARFTLRQASAAEVARFRAAAEERKRPRIPPSNLKLRDLRPLPALSAADVSFCGAKAANLGVLATAASRSWGESSLSDDPQTSNPGPAASPFSVPPGFCIPFAHYVAHLERNHLAGRVAALLRDRRMASDATYRKQRLEALRNAIRQAALDPRLLDQVAGRIERDLGGLGVFVRSSTNSEDLPGFNGAGLYDTVPNVRGRQALADAIRTVWASLWNFRAFEERSFFGIRHDAVYAGILVQQGIDAEAAGVLVTVNLFDRSDDHSFTINAKRGLGLRVVDGRNVPEQVVYDTWNSGTRIVTRSDEPTMLVFDAAGGLREVPNPNRGVILSEARARQLGEAARFIQTLFPPGQPLDIEWVLGRGGVHVVQTRPYVER